ncbi:MAG: sigma-70 family polymerase sigma factor [Planctomycetota bacterium]|nr:sigma-70 family polymerase sigma factor [Planctomycetota bacterium]
MSHDEASDRSLVRRFRHGQADAPTQLYLRYAQRLHALAAKQTSGELARRVEPEDIVQSVFRTFFRRLAAGNYDVPDGEEIWKLLLVIALNKIRTAGNFHKAAKRDMRRTSQSDALEAGLEATSGTDEVAMTVLRLVVDDLLKELPESHRKMVELRIEGHEVAEIAEEVGRSKRSVERALQEFRARLGALIHEVD